MAWDVLSRDVLSYIPNWPAREIWVLITNVQKAPLTQCLLTVVC